ncbi:hypothetical protein G6O69_35870 [Pseudenhygromyxa sp. WMMC2535]|uniref:VIT and vWA domain-containing protein n=1 Tax=Pseudenhygromyxa sp. WMMC2535 TaxID=2712867 RepID=UPI0015566B12|nr:VIT and VWA domain-containing protein [Pseudenhygromyxa sp. WMMC2535]NVB43258.1 hypothetical protein [Pseudenhygromyxa sp. WMMC2535]
MSAATIFRAPVLCSIASLLSLLTACQAPSEGQGASASAEAGSAEAPAELPVVAKVTKVRGSRGLSSPALPEGAFLGEGAALHAGQVIELPRGTRAELELGEGLRLRLDEDSRLTLPEAASGDSPPKLTLERGRLIVLATAEAPEGRAALIVAAADDELHVERGEVELHHAGETRHYGVVQGRSLLHHAEREIPLGPGASISTPAAPETRPETPPDPNILAFTPALSLAPLQEAAWAKAFEDSQALAESLPEGVGSLVARRAGSSVERQSLRIGEQKVEVAISGRIARTQIEQSFVNDSSQTLEGIYQFPLPADASISDLQLLVGDTWVRGEMLEKTRARQIFRQIVDATVPRDPALLQWEKGGIFKLDIFPIPGHGERRIKIAYTQVLPEVADTLRYRYPMGGSGATATEIGEFEFSVEVDGRELDEDALAKVSTPMAELARERRGAGLRLDMRERDYQPTHELGVDVPLAKDARKVMAATHRDADGQGYFMLSLEPELKLQADPRPVHYAFVLDRSHGTTPELWTAAEGLSRAMLSTLEPDDRFTVLACDAACDRLSGGLRSASEGAGQARELERFLDAQVLAGASDIGNMLEQAAAALGERRGDEGGLGGLGGEGGGEAERVIVYLGDGIPTSGALTPDELGALVDGPLATTRVQAVAMGARSDLLVLDSLVRQSGGDLLRADARDDLHALARELRLRAQVPVARDLELELPPGLREVYPKSIPALRPGDTLTLVGKLADGDPAALRGDLRLRGRSPSGVVDERFAVMLDAEYSVEGGAWAAGVHAHLPRTWAQEEISHLTQTEGASAKDRIVALSREYNVLSRWTALLVLENDRMYREFNVARKAGNKHGWDGKLGETEAAKTATTKAKAEEKVAGGGFEAEPSADAASAPSPSSVPVPMDEPTLDLDPASPMRERGEAEFADAKDMRSEDFDDFEDMVAFDEEEPEAEAEFSGDFGEGGGSKKEAGKGRGALGPAPAGKPAKAKSSSTSSKGWSGQGWGSGGWSGDGGWQEPRPRPRPRPQLRLRDANGPSPDERGRIATLQRQRDAQPGDRKIHRDLVRAAVRAGDPSALAHAAAWAEADPDHAPALLAHADALAAAGDPLALRAYASAVEVAPFSVKLHERMATALARAGDFERACSHRRALVSIDPSSGERAAALVECLAESGRVDAARAAAAQAGERVRSDQQRLSKAAAAVQGRAKAVAPRTNTQRVHGSPELRAELRWEADENLDVAFVDKRGRRLSVLRPQGVLIREAREGGERLEVMTMREVRGRVFVEVTRPETRSEEPIVATLVVKTPSGRKTWRLQLDPGTRRVAAAKWD